MRYFLIGLVSCLAVTACMRDRTYPPRTFTWSGDVPAGGTIKVRNIDGAIAVVPATGTQLSVSAQILNAAPSAVQVREESNSDELVFCTQLGSQISSPCESNNGREHSTHFSVFSLFRRSHPITVLYTLHVPAGAKLDMETVNGRIAAQDVGGNVKASTVNGDVVVSTTLGTVNAETVNGSIVASMAAVPDSGNVHLETVNGSITSVLPETIGGSFDLENVNGKINANFPHGTPDSADAHHMRFTLSPAPRRVHLETVNGSVSVTQYVKAVKLSLLN